MTELNIDHLPENARKTLELLGGLKKHTIELAHNLQEELKSQITPQPTPQPTVISDKQHEKENSQQQR